MLITRWNEASRALPVLALKSNYLDGWLNDCIFIIYSKFRMYGYVYHPHPQAGVGVTPLFGF